MKSAENILFNNPLLRNQFFNILRNLENEKKELVAKKLAELFELDYDKVLKKITKRSSIETIVKKVEKESQKRVFEIYNDKKIKLK